MTALLGIMLAAVSSVLIPWSVLRREKYLLRSREIRRKNPRAIFGPFLSQFVESMKKMAVSAEDAQEAMGRMARAFGPRRR